MPKNWSLIILFLLSSCLCALAQNNSSKTKTIQFAGDRFKFSPSDFHISEVIDGREDTSGIGFVKIGMSDRKATLQLYGGAAASVKGLLYRNMRQYQNTTPVELHISTLKVSEKRTNGIDEAKIEMAFAFYVNGDNKIELSSEASAKSGLDVTAHIEVLLRKQIESAIKQFGEWFSKNKTEILAAPSINVEVTVNNAPKDTDYIPFSIDRPLTYSDFKAKPDKLSIAAAATATTVSLDATVLTKGQHVTLQIKIGALFNRELSWFKEDAKHQRVLAHEQVHFDITTYMACELIHAIQNYSFSPENYEEELQQLKKKSERETQQMQEAYDEETNHGLIEDKQSEWSNKVIELLLLQDCFK